MVTTDDLPVFDPTIHVREATSLRFWILGAVVLVALAAAALIVALSSSSNTSGSALQTGSGTANIVVTLPRTGQPSFSGTLDGRPLTGVISGNGTTNSIGGGTIADYRGRLGSVPYVLHVSLKPIQSGQVTFAVTGTYGSKPVTATAEFGASSATSQSLTVPFNGRVGTQPVSGVATATVSRGNGIRINATLSVSPGSI